MTATADNAEVQRSLASKLGITAGQVVQEIGYDEDGDLVDALVDAIAILADQGVVWLLTPKPGRDGHVESAEISDAAPTAGLQSTSTISASREWQGTRLVAPRVVRR